MKLYEVDLLVAYLSSHLFRARLNWDDTKATTIELYLSDDYAKKDFF